MASDFNDNDTQFTSRAEKYHGGKKKRVKKSAEKLSEASDETYEDIPAEEDIPVQEPETSKDLTEEITPVPEEENIEIPNYDEDISEFQSRTEAGALDPSPKKKGVKPAVFAIVIIIIAIAVILANIFLIGIVRIDGNSMEPTLSEGEIVVVDKISRYFEFPGKTEVMLMSFPDFPGQYVKRIIAYPGEVVEIKDNVVYVNDSPLDEQYIDKGADYPNMEATTVPENCVFVLGDNRSSSLDSRSPEVGCVPSDCLIGAVKVSVWPFDKIRVIN